MTEPPPRIRICPMAYLQHRYTEVRLTSCTSRHASNSVVRIESSSGGEIPALLKAMSTPPYSFTAAWNSSRTSGSEVTSTATYRPPTSVAALPPASSSASPQTTLAPSAANRRAVASPIPLPAPVTTATCRRDDSPWRTLLCPDVQPFEKKTFLVSVKARGASGPSSRPSPDDLKPPKGVQ